MVTVTSLQRSLPGVGRGKRSPGPAAQPSIEGLFVTLSRTQMFPQHKGTVLPPKTLHVTVSRPTLPLHPEHRGEGGSKAMPWLQYRQDF